MLEVLRSTMLIERFCGVFVYALTLMCTYYSLKKVRSYRRFSRILNVYLVILTVMGFFYIPAESADLYRWRLIIENWHTLSFSEFYETYMRSSTYPMSLLLMYLCQQTRIDGVLPAVCALLFHWNVFAILKMLYKKHGYAARDLSLAMLMFMSMGRLMMAISGIRSGVATAILAKCFCDEFLNKKIRIWNIIQEILAALIHPLALVYVAIRLVFLAIQNTRKWHLRLLNLILSVILIAFGVKYGTRYIDAAVEKASYFLIGDTYWYIWEYILSSILFAVQVYVLYLAHGVNKTQKVAAYHNLVMFNALMMLIAIVFCFVGSIFHRTHTFFSITMIPLVVFVLRNIPSRQLRRLLLYTSWLVLAIACARGDICGYKFFLLF